MSSVLQDLEELRPESGKRVLGDLRGLRMYLQDIGRDPVLLVKPKQIANGRWTVTLKGGVDSIARLEGRVAHQKVKTLPSVVEDNYTYRLNTALLGGKDYPVLTAVLGAGLGAVSGPASFIFGVGTTALNVGKRSQRILARGGDEIWQVEEIGKVRSGSSYKPTHVLSYFLVDPFRKSAGKKAWLIHEQRREISL